MTYETLKQSYHQLGYKFREEKMALNISGTRSKESKSDKFDDVGRCAWIDEKGIPNLFTFPMTTDPGKHWLLTPMDKKGCIIMVPGQYIEVYGQGLHNGKYPCFKQMKDMCYVRDYNNDTILNFDLYRNPEKRKIYPFWGVNGTNLHRANSKIITTFVGPASAGCMVVQNPKDFDKLMSLQYKSADFGYKFWDWTLFEE